MKKVLILGASSWLSFLLSKKITALDASIQILGTVRSSNNKIPWITKIFKVSEYSQYISILSQEKPSLIINFLRGEEPSDFKLHNELVEYCLSSNSFYLYASSALALDGYTAGMKLLESLPPKSISPYGIFKGKCEESLCLSGASHLILRFSSIQGWIPNKVTRNQLFLEKMSRGESVEVDGGVLQNRLYDETFIDIVIELLRVGAEGIFNLGTVDSSSEVSFLRRQAEIFGWNPDLVVEGKSRNANLVVEPDKLISTLGDKFKKTENETLNSLLKCSGLAQYKNSACFHRG